MTLFIRFKGTTLNESLPLWQSNTSWGWDHDSSLSLRTHAVQWMVWSVLRGNACFVCSSVFQMLSGSSGCCTHIKWTEITAITVTVCWLEEGEEWFRLLGFNSRTEDVFRWFAVRIQHISVVVGSSSAPPSKSFIAKCDNNQSEYAERINNTTFSQCGCFF